MSDLAAVLARRQRPGLFRWDGPGYPFELQRTVEAAGWEWTRIHGWAGEADTKSAFLRSVGVALALPDHYGHNLDALADCLSGLERATVLLWDGWGSLAESDPATFAAVRAIVGDHTGEREQTAPLVVLLRGLGPAVDVPLLV